jgi:hypothetical protein
MIKPLSLLRKKYFVHLKSAGRVPHPADPASFPMFVERLPRFAENK